MQILLLARKYQKFASLKVIFFIWSKSYFLLKILHNNSNFELIISYISES